MISLGPIILFGFTAAIASIVGMYFFVKEAKKRGYQTRTVVEVSVVALVAGAIGARVMYLLVYDPLAIAHNENRGFSLFGGLLGGIIAACFYLKWKKLPVLKTFDIAAPFLILAQGIGIIGHNVFGLPTSSDPIWTIRVEGQLVHPVQAYEFSLNYVLFGYLSLRLKSNAFDGQVFFHYLMGLLIIQCIVDFFIEMPLVVSILSAGQVVSLVGIFVVVVIKYFYKKQTLIIPAPNVERYEIAKVWMYIWSLAIGSLLAYYLLHV